MDNIEDLRSALSELGFSFSKESETRPQTWEDWSPEKKGIFFANVITMVPFFFWWRHSRRNQGKRYFAFKYSEHDWATSGKQRTIHHLLMSALIARFRWVEQNSRVPR